LEHAVSSPLLFVTNDFGPHSGGIETMIIGLLHHRPFGQTIVYTSWQENSEQYDAEWLRDYGIRVIRDRSKVLLPTPRVAFALKKIIRKEAITTAAFGAAAPLGLLSASMKRAGVVRIVAISHGHEVWWAKVFPFNLLLRRIGSTVDVFTHLGDFTRSVISRALTTKGKAKLVQLAPGTNFDHFKPTDATQRRQSLGLTDKKVMVCVGRLVHRKGQDKLIEAMPEILTGVPNAHLLFVGDGPYREHLEELVVKNNVQQSVTFEGRVAFDDLPSYLCTGDIFAMPSRSRFMGLEVEGLGSAYLEATACGLPILAGNSGGVPDAVLHNKTGLVVDGTDAKQIAAAAIELLNDEQRRKQMSLFGRQWILDNWKWTKWSKDFEDLLQY
jgi:phosphatidylinositol alpha-1,6-mannosyltransferase